MRHSARIAIEELARRGWQDLAAQAERRWTDGDPFEPPPHLDRFTAALVCAANWDLDHGLEAASE